MAPSSTGSAGLDPQSPGDHGVQRDWGRAGSNVPSCSSPIAGVHTGTPGQWHLSAPRPHYRPQAVSRDEAVALPSRSGARLIRQPAGTSLGCANPCASLLCPSLMPDGFSRSCQIGGITRTAMGFVLTSPVSTQAGDTSSVAHRLLARATDKTQPVHGQIPTPPDFNRVWGLGAG